MKSTLLNRNNQKGFTLIELLVVIGILAILLAIVLVAINPARQFEQANDTQRSSDVNAILNAVHQYMVDNNGDPTALTIPATGTDVAITDGAVGDAICNALVPDYIAALPADPTGGDGPVDDCAVVGWTTAYSISQSATNSRFTVSAPLFQGTDPIEVTR